MSGRTHRYEIGLNWTGNDGKGTVDYRAYRRDHEITAAGKAPLAASSDPAFRGDRTRWNPEEMLVAAIASCHMLWFLHLASDAGIVVTDYRDQPRGTMAEDEDGAGRFTEVVLHPTVIVRGDVDPTVAAQLHHTAHEKCFIANSVNFPVRCEPSLQRDG
ncbi:MAG: OsmC family protein [Rhodospirillaceae bacterium]|nr:OsmC family protein [Rhodospirillaceae bacterium]